MLPLIFMAVEMFLFDNTVLKIKLPYKFMYLFHFVYLLHKTMCLKNMIQRLIHDLFPYNPSIHISSRLRHGMIPELIWKRSCGNLYIFIGNYAYLRSSD